jgi:hypothetical protein
MTEKYPESDYPGPKVMGYSPIGRDQCGVRRDDGEIDRVVMFDSGRALVVFWCGISWQTSLDPWVWVPDLATRYAYIADTVGQCEAWIKEQEQPKLRFIYDIVGGDPFKFNIYDAEADEYLKAWEATEFLNAADHKTEGGE